LNPESRVFKVVPLRKTKYYNQSKEDNFMGSKIVPGMEISYVIKFSPNAKKDYIYNLEVITEREKFIVPIKAIGQKALLEFPDKIDFGTCPVK